MSEHHEQYQHETEEAANAKAAQTPNTEQPEAAEPPTYEELQATGIWGLGYAGAVLLRQWPSAIGRINIASVLILSVLVVAMNSPLLDPYRLAANNQVDRLLGGQIAPADFDYLYLRFSLGRYGKYALIRLREAAHPRADAIRRRIEAAMRVDPLQ